MLIKGNQMAIDPGNLHHLLTMLLIFAIIVLTQAEEFVYNGFKGSNNLLHLDGVANIQSNGLLQMTNFSLNQISHAFYPKPVIFKPNSSFSSTFIFAMVPQVNHSSHGIVFVISPTMNFQQSYSSGYLGLFNNSTNGLPSNHLFAVEFEPIPNGKYGKRQRNHVGIDLNSLKSVDIATASYFSDKEGKNRSLLLGSGEPIQVWIDYDEMEMLINVTLAPFNYPRPSKCLLSMKFNLSSILLDSKYIGFSSSTGGQLANNNYILGWSWNQSGQAQSLDPSKLPSLPRNRKQWKSFNLTFLLLLMFLVLLLMIIVGVSWVIWKKRYKELKEPWEEEYAPHRLSYKDILKATKGFKNSELLGVGGFGKVYKGILPTSQAQVAVLQVAHDSRQGMKEFVAEIASMRRLRHRNLVHLLGYCRRKGELLLVYDYMPNGSLDKFLFGDHDKPTLCWSQRFHIIKGVASALLYLHEGWEQVVLHRDVKASNVLLDGEMNARLGDFGLARLHDHGTNLQTTHVVGTIGYIAPEASRTRKPTTRTDVFAFGIFLLEVACGRRPIDKQHDAVKILHGATAEFFLVDWVHDCWKKGKILTASDLRLEGSFDSKEMEMVFRLGLICANPKAENRPNMRQVVQFLQGVTMPEIPSDYDPQGNGSFFEGWETSTTYPLTIPSSSLGNVSHGILSTMNSALHHGC